VLLKELAAEDWRDPWKEVMAVAVEVEAEGLQGPLKEMTAVEAEVEGEAAEACYRVVEQTSK